tara:strand:+ start:786 stop:3536 length:2751 start_codon:yes stop_codon:yes gene_type:complete
MSTYENDLRLEEIGSGERSGTWGTATNTNLSLVAEAFSYGTEAITTNADTHTTTIADGATDEGRSFYLKYTGTLDSTCTITLGPNTISKVWLIENATSGSQSIVISQGSGASITIPNGSVKMVATDGAGSGAAVLDLFTDLDVEGTFNVAGAFTGQSTISGTSITASTSFLPDASGGADIGTSSLEFGDVYIADDKYIKFGSDQNVLVGYDETTTDTLKIAATEGAGLGITLMADEGDDAGDEWKLNIADGGTLTLGNDINSAGTYVTHFTITPNSTATSSTVTIAGGATLGGNLVIPNDGNIGSVGDTDAIDIDSSGVVTMNQIPVFSAGINVSGGTIVGTLATAAQTNITSVGALGGGSISSGFGNIDNGSSSITTTGTITYGSLSDGTTTISSVDQDISSVSGSHDTLATAKAIKTYVDSQTVTATGLSGTGTENVHIGGSSLANITSDAVRNTAFGQEAGEQITSGDLNTAIGYQALQAATTDQNHVAIGLAALGSTNESYYSGELVNGIVGVGAYAGFTNVTGRNQTFVGTKAGRYLVGGQNTAIGDSALQGVSGTTTSDVQQCVAVGYNSMSAITTGDSNTAVGASAGAKITTGHYNILVGQEAHGPTTGDNNVGIGRGALSSSLTSGDDNVAVGFEAMRYGSGSYNIAVGPGALEGSSSTAMSGSDNVAIGRLAGNNTTTASDSIFIGGLAGRYNHTAESCVYIGYSSGNNNSNSTTNSGNNNIGVGTSTGYNITTGASNTMVGYAAGSTITTGSVNTCLGNDAEPSSATASGEFTLGDSNVSTLRCNDTSISSLSDERDKTDIVDSSYGLDFINTIRPVQFKWDRRDLAKGDKTAVNNGKTRLGFLAQEFQKAMPNKENETLNLVHENNSERLETKMGNLIPILTKAIQDLSKQNKELENRIVELENK